MTYDLYIGDQMFSSWSLRGWLMFERFDIPPARTHLVGLYTGTLKQDLELLAPPARLVPVLRTPEGTVVGDTLAMAETLAERHPDAGLWPSDPDARALARWLVAEMHSGFPPALRDACPMQLHSGYTDFAPSDAVRADLARIEDLWSLARHRHGGADGPPGSLVAIHWPMSSTRPSRPASRGGMACLSGGTQLPPMLPGTLPTLHSAAGVPLA